MGKPPRPALWGFCGAAQGAHSGPRAALSLDDLTAAPSNRPPVPTFAEYVPVVAATVTPGTLRAYRPYWKRTVEQWGDRHLDEPTPSEIKQLVAYV